MNFYERCEQLVRLNKMTMKDLGEVIGVTGASITGWKTGSLPRVDIALKIAKCFGVTVEYLMTGETEVDKVLSTEDTEILKLYSSVPDMYKSVVKSTLVNLVQQFREFTIS